MPFNPRNKEKPKSTLLGAIMEQGNTGPPSATDVPDVWYYADQRGPIGPLSLDELKVIDWKRAADVSELRGQAEPALCRQQRWTNGKRRKLGTCRSVLGRR